MVGLRNEATPAKRVIVPVRVIMMSLARVVSLPTEKRVYIAFQIGVGVSLLKWVLVGSIGSYSDLEIVWGFYLLKYLGERVNPGHGDLVGGSSSFSTQLNLL